MGNDNAAPLDADAIRRNDLEESILQTLSLIKEYEDIIRMSDDPKEVGRCKKKLPDLRTQLQEYQIEYAELTAQETSPSSPATLSPFAEAWIAQLPYPIAVCCATFNQAADETVRFLALDNLLLNTTKYLAAIALAQYRRDHRHSAQLRPWLNRLSRHHLSEWAALLDEIDQHYRQDMDTRPAMMTLLFDAYRRSVTSDTAMAQIHHDISDRMQVDAMTHSLTIGHFITSLVAYRERTWEAGILHLPQGFGETLTPLLQPALQELLNNLPIIRDYPLRYADGVRQTSTGWVCNMADWRGPTGQPSRNNDVDYRSDKSSPEAPYKARRLYLCHSDGQPLLNLHPLLIHHKDYLYFLEAFGEDEQLAFRPCHGGQILDIPADLLSSLTTIFKSLSEEEAADTDTGASLDEIEEKVDEMNAPPPPEELSLPELLQRFGNEGLQVLEFALGESLRIGRFWLGVEFLIMGLSRQPRGIFFTLLREMQLHPGELRGALRGMVGVVEKEKDQWRNQNVTTLGKAAFSQLQVADPDAVRQSFATNDEQSPIITPRMLTILQGAARLAGENQVEPVHLVVAAFRHHRSLAIQLFFSMAYQAGWSPEQVLTRLADLAGADPQDLVEDKDAPDFPADLPPPPDRSGRTPLRPSRGGSVATEFGRDLTQAAQAGQLHPAEGESARRAMAQMGRILLQREANNPILVGDPGVGKTALVEGFAYRLAGGGKGAVKQLAGRRVIELSANTLTAGTKYRGQLEERLQQLLAEVKKAKGQIILFIDEIHSLLEGGSTGGLADALKPALSRGEFPCIGATTMAEYRQHIEKDAALARRFTPVWLEEPSLEEAIEIVDKVATGHLAEYHNTTFAPEAIEAAVRLSARYLHEERLPGKAIKLLDQAASGLIIGGSLSGEADDDQSMVLGGTVTADDILEIVADRTNIPLTQLGKTDKERLLELEGKLKDRLIGQDEAVSRVVRVVKRAGAGLSDPRRPQGVFLFAGPTGVGKTELALALTEALFDNEEAIFRLDMSEFMEKHQVARLIGAPPGYVGYETEGQLTGRLRRQPYSVVLLDEIEKAHEDVQHLFLQLFDNGRLTDAQGRLADGRNAIFIMTTNLGAKEALGLANMTKSYQEKLLTAIREHFTMEFINRIDRIVYFNPLDEAALLAIFDRELLPFQRQLKDEKGLELTVPPDLKQQIVQHVVQQKLGARPLRRFIEDKIIAPIVDKLLTEEYEPGGRLTLGSEIDLDSIHVPPDSPLSGQMPLSFDPGKLDLGGVGPPAAQSPRPERPTTPEAGLPHLDNVDDEHQTIFDERYLGLAQRLADQGITLEIDSLAKYFLCAPSTEDIKPREGRSVKQAFDELIEEPLTEKLLEEEYKSGDWIKIDYSQDTVKFKRMGDE